MRVSPHVGHCTGRRGLGNGNAIQWSRVDCGVGNVNALIFGVAEILDGTRRQLAAANPIDDRMFAIRGDTDDYMGVTSLADALNHLTIFGCRGERECVGSGLFRLLSGGLAAGAAIWLTNSCVIAIAL